MGAVTIPVENGHDNEKRKLTICDNSRNRRTEIMRGGGIRRRKYISYV